LPKRSFGTPCLEGQWLRIRLVVALARDLIQVDMRPIGPPQFDDAVGPCLRQERRQIHVQAPQGRQVLALASKTMAAVLSGKGASRRSRFRKTSTG
jgi:hypothetical protein